MAITSGANTPFRSGGFRYAPFTLNVYLREYKDYLNTYQFDATTSNGDVESIYGPRNGFDRGTTLGAWTRR